MILISSRRGKPIRRKKRARDTLIYWGDELLVQVMPDSRSRWFCVVHGDLLQGAVRGIHGMATVNDCIEYAFQARGVGTDSPFMTVSEGNCLAISGALKDLAEQHPDGFPAGMEGVEVIQQAAQEYYDKFRASRDARCEGDD